MVLVEAAVLDRDDGLLDHVRDVLEPDLTAVLLGVQFGQPRPVRGLQHRGLGLLDELGRVTGVERDQRAAAGQQEDQRERHANAGSTRSGSGRALAPPRVPTGCGRSADEPGRPPLLTTSHASDCNHHLTPT